MRRCDRRLAVPAVFLLATLLPAAVAGAAPTDDDWPQFRGARGSAAVAAAAALQRPDLGLKVTWRSKLGSGYSGVVIAAGRVVTMFSDGKSDLLVALDELSGAELWRYTMGEATVGHDGSHNGPLSTPLIAGDVVVALGSRGNLVAVEAATGTLRWSADLPSKYGSEAPFYGFATSPVLVPGAVVVAIGAPKGAVAAFDLRTGEKKWDAGSDSIQYGTPLLLEHRGRQLLVAAGMAKVFGIDPASGAVLWEYAHEGTGGGYGAPKLTPVAAGEGRLLLTSKETDSRLVRLIERDGVSTVEKVWETPSIRHSYNDPVYLDGYLYGFSGRFLTCLDAATGEARWKSRPPGDGFLMLVGDRLVIVTKEGSVHVVRATPDGYEEIASHAVFSQDLVWSPPSFAHGHIFVRSLGEVARLSVGGDRTVMTAGSAAGADASGTPFGRFLASLDTAPDRQAAVDAYLAGTRSFPIVEGERVHFVYSGPGEDLGIEGEMFGASVDERMIPVKGTNLFYYSMRAAPDTRANYVLVRDYVEILDPRNPRQAVTNVLGPDMELAFDGAWEMSWFAMPGWVAPAYLDEAPAARRGRVVSKEIESATLKSKLSLQVYLPAGYDAGEQRYPVIYVHGGGEALEAGGWGRALDNLIGSRVEPVIVAFLPGGSIPPQQYVGVFLGELLPYVEATFRTRPQPEQRASVGHGFGGILAFLSALEQPGVVGKVATQGGFFTEGAWGPIQGMLKTAKEQPLEIYMDWGLYDLTSPLENWSVRVVNQRAVEELRKRGYAPKGGEAHDGAGWPSWRNRTGDLLQALFPKAG